MDLTVYPGCTQEGGGTAMPKLTDAVARRLRATDGKRLVIRDAGGHSLYLVISPSSGLKTFTMRFRRPGGKVGKLTLGPFYEGDEPLNEGRPLDPVKGAPLTLAMARELALRIHRERALGRDVIGEHKVERQRQRRDANKASRNSFVAAARLYVEQYARRETKRWRDTARYLGLIYPEDRKAEPTLVQDGLAERWLDKPVTSIDADDVWAAVDEARLTGVHGSRRSNKRQSDSQARALFSTLSALFGWLVAHRRVKTNPTAGIRRPAVSQARERVLTPDEIKWFWQACDALEPRGGTRVFAPLLRLLLVTAQRRGEVAGIRRGEIDAAGMWHIPGSRTKNGRDHRVPLPKLALDLVASAVSRPSGDLIFSTTGKGAPTAWAKTKARLDAAMTAAATRERGEDFQIEPWRLHDLRRTAVTGMAEQGTSSEVIELIVNHASGTRGGVAGTYNRSERMEERVAALRRWARRVDQIVGGGEAAQVVELDTRARRRGRRR
jgi:integrase